jgi:hypothetical protein
LKCPHCKAQTEIKNEADGPWYSVKLRACLSLGCKMYAGFFTIEAITDDGKFRNLVRRAEIEARPPLYSGPAPRAEETETEGTSTAANPDRLAKGAAEVRRTRNADPASGHPWKRAQRAGALAKADRAAAPAVETKIEPEPPPVAAAVDHEAEEVTSTPVEEDHPSAVDGI